jgi:formylglycine-generating enzyme required for sulfatase activity
VKAIAPIALVALFSSTTTGAVNIDMVPVGYAGNKADGRYGLNGIGSVGYHYRIGKYEVTNAQYALFLNSVDPTGANTLALYSTNMTSNANGGIIRNLDGGNGAKYEVKLGRDYNPVIYASWFDAIRFANWLHNGEGAGNTENGAYTLLGGTPTPSNGDSITRNPGARFWLPSEDEWYKAAFYKHDGVTGNYLNYPMSTNAVPNSDQPPGNDAPNPSNTANFHSHDFNANGYDDGYAVTGSTSFSSSQNYLTDVGAYTLSIGPFGTFDQGGNVWEWNDSFIESPIGNSRRGWRGSSWGGDYQGLHAAYVDLGFVPWIEREDTGFRIATLIPEPSSLLLVAIGSLILRYCKR